MTTQQRVRRYKAVAQRGSVLWILLGILVLGSSYFLITRMNQLQGPYSRSESDVAVMRQAIDGLIGYAITQARDGLRPGSLPCPDTNGDGVAEGSCANANLVGRLPWKTLKLPELRDSSGALLWYALSSNFRNVSSSVINNNTAGQLSLIDALNGNITDSEIVAAVFAPGAPVAGQTRINTNLLSDYLEGANSSSVFSRSQTSTAFSVGQCFNGRAIACNDQLLTLKQEDLFDAIEPVIADRLSRAIPNELEKYFRAWNRYPNPVPFEIDPMSSQDSLLGSAGTKVGWLPLSRLLRSLAYETSGVSLEFNGLGNNPPSGINCGASGADKLSCQLTQPCDGNGKSMRLQFSLKNAGNLFFASTFSPNGISGANYRSFTPEDIDTTTKRLTLSFSPNPSANLAITHSLVNSGSDLINFVFALPSRTGAVCSNGQIDLGLTMNAPSKWDASSAFIDSISAPASGDPLYWFHANKWYQQLVYVLAPAYAPGGSGTCGRSGEDCIKAIWPDNTEKSNFKVLLVFAGRKLAGQDRSTANARAQLANYLESSFDSSNNLVFRVRAATGPTAKLSMSAGGFNDRYIWISE